jgi:hypothetical protein
LDTAEFEDMGTQRGVDTLLVGLRGQSHHDVQDSVARPADDPRPSADPVREG